MQASSGSIKHSTYVPNMHKVNLPPPCILDSFIRIKINLNFYFHTSLWSHSFKAFIKHFVTPQGSVKEKILVNFFSSSGIGAQRGKSEDAGAV